MKFLKPICLLVFCTVTLMNCKAQEDLSHLNVLLGTWKIENKSTFETWEKVSDSEYKGESYKQNETTKQVTEGLAITIDKGKVVYKATVKNQNQGHTIPFELNVSETDVLSFENLEHDFPKKIQYKKIDNDKLLVSVLGENNQGFSYYLIRQ